MTPCLARCTGKTKANHVPSNKRVPTKAIITGIKMSREVAAVLLETEEEVEGVVVVLVDCILNESEPVVEDSLSSGIVLCCAMMSPPSIVRCARSKISTVTRD